MNGEPKITVHPCQWSRAERIERLVMLIGVIVVLLDVFMWRPG